MSLMKRNSILTCFPEPKAACVNHLIEVTPGTHFSNPSGKPAVPVVFSQEKKQNTVNIQYALPLKALIATLLDTCIF